MAIATGGPDRNPLPSRPQAASCIQADFERRVAAAARRLPVNDKPRRPSPPSLMSEAGKLARRKFYAPARGLGGLKIHSKKKMAARPLVEISGDQNGQRFEAELAAIKRSLKGAQFIAAGGILRLVSAKFDWAVERRAGWLTTSTRPAAIEDLQAECRRRRVRFFRTSSGKHTSFVPKAHFAELIRRAHFSRGANDCFPCFRIDSDGTILASSPALYFGQHRRFANG